MLEWIEQPGPTFLCGDYKITHDSGYPNMPWRAHGCHEVPQVADSLELAKRWCYEHLCEIYEDKVLPLVGKTVYDKSGKPYRVIATERSNNGYCVIQVEGAIRHRLKDFEEIFTREPPHTICCGTPRYWAVEFLVKGGPAWECFSLRTTISGATSLLDASKAWFPERQWRITPLYEAKK